jgi:hypothetical protein
MFNKNRSVIFTVFSAAATLLFLSTPASAHHEAMFGPQSSAVLSPGMFISLQMFDREDGVGGYRHRQTISVYSLGVKPFETNPVSFAVVAANTREAYTYQGSTTRFEDPLISGRYRVEDPGIAKALGVQESYVMGVGGFEVPLGNKDHAAGHGPVGEIAAGLFSVEKRPIAGIAYAYYHHPGAYNAGMPASVDGTNVTVTRQNGNFFTGTGVAYTPIDDDARGHLFSMQLGLSYEKTFALEYLGKPITNSGASAVMMHPGLVFQMTPRFQFFSLVSIPLTQQAEAMDYNQRFRLGFGTIIMLGHSGKPPVK